MHPTIIFEVTHPETGEILGYEIIDNIKNIYFVSRSAQWEGLRSGEFPNDDLGRRFPRRKIVRLETVGEQDEKSRPE